MRIDVFSLFPELVDAPLAASIVGRARSAGMLDLRLHDIRIWTSDVHRTVDDAPFGGGAGMVMKIDPIVSGVEHVQGTSGPADRILLLAANGTPFNQTMAKKLSRLDHLMLICGHYEGVDGRIPLVLGAEELSIGDYVLTGGELAAAVVIDCITRLLPGVIRVESTENESHSGNLLEHPHFTRPASYRGHEVPAVLLTGNHAEIQRWRRRESLKRTAERRPDMLTDDLLTDEERAWVRTLDVRSKGHERP